MPQGTLVYEDALSWGCMGNGSSLDSPWMPQGTLVHGYTLQWVIPGQLRDVQHIHVVDALSDS